MVRVTTAALLAFVSLTSKAAHEVTAFRVVSLGSSKPTFLPTVSDNGSLHSPHISSPLNNERTPLYISTTALFGKKKKGGGGGGGGRTAQAPQEKQSVKDARFDAATRQFMFTIMNLSKALPDKSKTLLKNINLCFYPGAKIGVVGLNGSGKSTLLKIMAGIDKEFDGIARPLPGASIGYLPQEPVLQYPTVRECIDAAVQSSRDMLNEYNELGVKLADPSLSEDEMNSLMNKLATMGDEIEAKNLWDLDRVVERAMDALRLPAGDAATDVLSGGEKRRVSLCQLLLGNHDMLLLGTCEAG